MLAKDLNGAWNLKQSGKRHSITAAVPGSVHTDLLADGKIPDPYCCDNENGLQWIDETDWVYYRTFNLSKDFLRQRLRVHSLIDTYC